MWYLLFWQFLSFGSKLCWGKKKKSAVCTFCTSKAIKLMPHPPKRASQAKAQQLPGNLTFTKIIEEEEGSEWEEESESERPRAWWWWLQRCPKQNVQALLIIPTQGCNSRWSSPGMAICMFYPKFHWEINPIEMLWGYMKYRKAICIPFIFILMPLLIYRILCCIWLQICNGQNSRPPVPQYGQHVDNQEILSKVLVLHGCLSVRFRY